MDYNYTNLSSFFIYGEGDAELWETSYGEYFYPYVPNTYMDVDIEIETPDSRLNLSMIYINLIYSCNLLFSCRFDTK